jgi:hypothetical protein
MILRRVIAHFCLLNVIVASLVLQLVEAAGATQGAD